MVKITPTEEEKELLKTLRDDMKKVYDSMEPIKCPALDDVVHFNAKGWYHLKHNIHGSGRDTKSQINKLSLIPLIIPVLKIADNVDEHRKIKVSIKRKKGAQKTLVDYYALVAYVGKKRNIKVKVIIIKPESAEKTIFWSVMRIGTKKAPK